jgi:hypothetical protein
MADAPSDGMRYMSLLPFRRIHESRMDSAPAPRVVDGLQSG